MRKKSTIFALVAVLCIAAALYFMQRETKEMYSDGDDLLIDEAEAEAEAEAEPKPRRTKRAEQVKQPTDESATAAAEGESNE